MIQFDEALRVFVALFVVMNALPLLPLVTSMTSHMSSSDRGSLLNQAILAGGAVTLALIAVGPLLFKFIGIQLHDLRIGGGIVLLVFATHDLLFSRQHRKEEEVEAVGVVPLGVPIMIGPSTMATSLVLADVYGRGWVLVAFSVNLLVNWLLVRNAPRLLDRLGGPAVKMMGKIYALLLAAIAVSMVRNGIYGVISDFSASVVTAMLR